MEKEWADRVLSLKYWANADEAEEYEELVEQAFGKVTPDVAEILFMTFNSQDDHELQENVIRVLHSAPPEVYMRAMLAALPRLVARAPDWAEVFLLREVKHRPDLLLTTVSDLPQIVRETAVQIMSRPGFVRRRPNAQQLAAAIHI